MAPRDLGVGAQCKPRSGALNRHGGFRIGNTSENKNKSRTLSENRAKLNELCS